jgi:hypothetical protein
MLAYHLQFLLPNVRIRCSLHTSITLRSVSSMLVAMTGTRLYFANVSKAVVLFCHVRTYRLKEFQFVASVGVYVALLQ